MPPLPTRECEHRALLRRLWRESAARGDVPAVHQAKSARTALLQRLRASAGRGALCQRPALGL